jgi:hypothetical protein
MPVPDNRDLHVTLLILPRLEKYSSTTRFGIKSREFGDFIGGENGEPRQRVAHDGISFMIIGLRWVTNGAKLQGQFRGKARRERIRKALAEIEMAPAWISRPIGNSEDGGSREISTGWWKQQSVSKPPSEGDKENGSRRVSPEEGEQQQPQDQQVEAEKNQEETSQQQADGKGEREAEVEARKDAEPTTAEKQPYEPQVENAAEENGSSETQTNNGVDTDKLETEAGPGKNALESVGDEMAQPEKVTEA